MKLTILSLVAIGLSSASTLAAWTYERDGCKLEIDTDKSGQVIHWETGEKTFVDAKAHPISPLQLLAGNERQFVATSFEKSPDGDGVTVIGRLGEGIPATVSYRIKEQGRQLHIAVQSAAPEGVVESFSWNLPLALQPRKRVYYRGDRGMEWDNRYFYQFMASTVGTLMPQPDRNEWRYFGLDQSAPSGFRLWKAESAETSPLVMQEGGKAVPRVQIYDPAGGVTLEVLNAGKPFSLRVDAADGGVASVQFWSPVFASANAKQPGLFNVPHEVVITVHPSEEAVLQARKDWKGDDARPSVAEAMQEEKWVREAPAATGLPQYVTGGYPFAQGALKQVEQIRVSVAGDAVPVQAKALGFWPDGSVKWALVTFPIDPAKAVESCEPPRVSLRSGRFLPVKIALDAGKVVASSILFKAAQPDGHSAVISNGDLELKLATGANWIQSLTWKGKQLLDLKSKARLAYADYQLAPDQVLPFERSVKGGELDRGTLKVDSLAVEESGPLRTVVRLEGLTDNREPTRIILRLEILAGRPEIRITHTTVLRFKDPRKTFLRGLGIEVPLADAGSGNVKFGGVPDLAVPKTGGALLLQQTTQHSELLLEPSNALLEVCGKGEGWVSASGEAVPTFGMIRNFWQQAPKAIGVDAKPNILRFEFWPAAAEPMDTRRYSNYPHLAQGESVPPDDQWIDKYYSTGGALEGVSRTHEVVLAFGAESSGKQAQATAADYQSPPLLYAGWDLYQSAGVVLPTPDEAAWPKVWDSWSRLANFWLHHRSLYNWYGFWSFGDVRHHFRSGYGRIATPEAILNGRPWEQTNWSKAHNFANRGKTPPAELQQDYFPENDWAYDNGRWAWSNTEGLANLFLQNEYLRKGNRAVYFASEAMARHARDVVTRQEGQYFGLGTRHGVQHWSDGNHEERQTTITEYRVHYFLSGEGRSRDVIEKLYQEIYSKKRVTVHAGHSGRLGGLLFHWELTGSPEEREQLRRYVSLFLSPEGFYISPNVAFSESGPVASEPPKGLNDGNMFFHTFGGMHALIEYQQLTGDPALTASLNKMAESILNDPENHRRFRQGQSSSSRVFWPVLAFAAHHAPDPAPYRTLLKQYFEAGGWADTYQTVTKNPAHWSGPTAILRHNTPGSLFWVNWTPYVIDSLGPKELWNDQMAKAFDEAEANGKPVPVARSSWQTQYDGVPELEAYLGRQQPWNQKAGGVAPVQTAKE